MSSSTAEDGQELLAAVERAYQRAQAQLRRDDLAAVDASLDEVEQLLQRLASASVEHCAHAWRRAQESHARLLAALTETKDRSATELARARRGRVALRAYGGRSEAGAGRPRVDA